MAVTNYTTLLGLALPTTGDLAGTWGDTVNNSITSLLDSAVAGTTSITSDSDVTLTTTQGAANQARSAILNCTGARTALRTIIAPAASKAYVVINATTGGFGVKVVGAGPTTGVTINNGEKALIAWNGSDFVIVSTSVIDLGSEVSGVLPIANGGTNSTATPTNGGISYGTGTAIAYSAAGTSGQVLTSAGAASPTWTNQGSLTAGAVTNAVTFNNGGTGAVSGTTYNGSAARTISYNTVGAPSTTGANASGTWAINITGSAGSAGSAGSVTNSATFNNSGTGAASGTTFNGSAAQTISYNTVGAAPAAGSTAITTLGTIGTGTWQGSVVGSTYGGTGVNNGGRTLTLNTNSGTISYTNASTTLTVANNASISGTNTGDQTITLTGDVTGSGTGSFATTLANSGVTAGTYTHSTVTVDAKGRVTSASSGAAPSPFDAGTVMLFQQTAAPTGWTKLTTQDNKALRVVSGTAGTGGSVAFTTAFASQTPSGSVSVNISGVSAAATTLSTTQIPSHTHSITLNDSSLSASGIGAVGGTTTGSTSTGSAGGGGSHTHSLTGSATGAFTGNAINLAVQYVDVILASKN